MFVLDTDTLSHLLANRPQVVARHDAATRPVVIAVITWIEVLQGRFATLLTAADGAALLRGQERLDQALIALRPFRILPIDAAVVGVFDRLRGEKKLRKIGRADLLIASVCLAHKATLVTRNRKDFAPVAGLLLENWVD